MSRARQEYIKARELATIYHENGCGTGVFMAEVYAGALLMYEWCKDRFAPQLEKVRNARTAVCRRNKALNAKNRELNTFVKELHNALVKDCKYRWLCNKSLPSCLKTDETCLVFNCPLLKGTKYQQWAKQMLKKTKEDLKTI